MFEYHSFENWNIFERTEFKRTYKTCLYSNERFFSFETNFKRTTDEFRKNVIRSNDLSWRNKMKLIWSEEHNSTWKSMFVNNLVYLPWRRYISNQTSHHCWKILIIKIFPFFCIFPSQRLLQNMCYKVILCLKKKF